MPNKLFLPDDTNERGGRVVVMYATVPEITEVDEARATLKIEGLAVNENNPDSGAAFTLLLIGNQIKLPRAISNMKIVIEEE